MNIRNNAPLTLALILALSSCGSGGSSSSGFIVTASSKPIEVALSPVEKVLQFFIAQAYALIPTSLQDSNGDEVSIDTAWISLTKIKFKTESEDDADEESEDDNSDYHYKGPYFIDLLDETVSPLSDGEVPTTAIRRVEMKLHKATGSSELPDAAPSELDGNSIVLKGEINGSAFSFVADETTNFKSEAPQDIEADDAKNFAVALDLTSMFEKIDMSEITSDMDISTSNRGVSGDKCPDIANNANLYTCFRKGLELMANFGVDDDGDGDLSEEEVVRD